MLCWLGYPDIAGDDEAYTSDSSTPSSIHPSIHSGTSFSAKQGPTAKVHLPYYPPRCRSESQKGGLHGGKESGRHSTGQPIVEFGDVNSRA